MTPTSLEHVPASISAQEFFDRFVKTRTPCVLEGCIDDPEWQSGGSWTDLDYLQRKAGHSMLMVEPFNKEKNQYGTALAREHMSFSEYIDTLQKDDPDRRRYLTTQYEGQEGDKALSPPCDALANDFPIVPRVMGNLALQQVNLWLGRSPEQGSSSGLHHDFADNLYILLTGRKRFTLFPPTAAPHLMTNGQLDTVHPNGLISYAHAPTRADGLDARSAAQVRTDALEAQISALQDAANPDLSAIAKLEEQLEDAQDDLMGLLVADPNFEQEGDDLDQMTFEAPSDESDLEELDHKADVQAEAVQGVVEPAFSDEDDEEEGDDLDAFDHSAPEPIEPPKEPASFSQIPASTLRKFLEGEKVSDPEHQEALQRASSPVQVEIKPGSMLYLPASWFHEVVSIGDADRPHMAFNYWFFPPDAQSMEQPYTDPLVWDYIRQETQHEYDQAKTADRKGKRKRVEDPHTSRAKGPKQ